MPGSDDHNPAAVARLVRQAAGAADRAAELRAVTELAAAVGRTGAAAAFRALLAVGKSGPRLGLEFVSKLQDPLPTDVARAAVPVLADRSAPAPVRLAAAGRVLAAVPDEPRAVAPVIRAVTARLSPARALERLIQLQSRVDRCDALDAAVATTEAKVRLGCPRCPARLPRGELVKHLWHRHGLLFDRGRARDPRGRVDGAVTEAAKSGEPEAVDRTFLLTAQHYPDVAPRQVFQAVAARGTADPAQVDRLLARAAEDAAGLCPVCLSAVPDPVPPLPPPADVTTGRVAADGYLVAVRDGPGGRKFSVSTPVDRPLWEPDVGPRRSLRQAAARAAAGALVVAAAAVLLIPSKLVPPVWAAVGLAAAGWAVYLVVWRTSSGPPNRTRRAVELAWEHLVPEVGRTPTEVRLLTRVCRASVGAGDPGARAAQVYELVEQAAVLADKGGPYMQLLAAARVLQVLDAGRLGRERVSGLVGVFDPFVRGDLPPAYADAAAELVLADGGLAAGDVRRLAALVVGAAFVAGLKPADVALAAGFCPWVRRMLGDPHPDRLGMLYAVWKGQTAHPWRAVGDAVTVFELARDFPGESRRLLAAHPDALLRVDLGDAAEEALGPVLVTARGVAVAGLVAADPAAKIEVVATPAGPRLLFGPHRITPAGRVPTRTLDDLRRWLRYRAEVLLPAGALPADQVAGPRALGMLASLAVPCPLCGTRSLIRAGQMGTIWQAVAGAG